MILSQRPLLADCVEEVGALAVLGGARRQARGSLFAFRPASGRAAGPALPALDLVGDVHGHADPLHRLLDIVASGGLLRLIRDDFERLNSKVILQPSPERFW